MGHGPCWASLHVGLIVSCIKADNRKKVSFSQTSDIKKKIEGLKKTYC